MQAPFLAVLPSFAGGGAERVTLALLNSLAERGVPCHLAVLDASGPFGSRLSGRVSLHSLGGRRLRGVLPALLRLIWRIRPSVVYSTFGYVNLLLLAARLLFPAKTRIWIREANLPSLSIPNSRMPRTTMLGYRVLYRFADLVICSSQRMRAELVPLLGGAADRARVLPNPVVPVDFESVMPIPRNIDLGNVVFLASGRLTFQKGFDRLIDIFASLGPGNRSLLILGDGPLRAQLEDQVASHNLTSRVRFLGFQKIPEAYYLTADALVMPSRWEGMPNVALEALECGLRVIATPECGGLIELSGMLPPGAIEIAPIEELAEILANVKGEPRARKRQSYLPDSFRIDSVADRFQSWLNDEIV
jgi:glycosyltransferase involved in cell wall biosynthesis